MSKFDEIVNGYKNLVKSKLGLSSEKDEEILRQKSFRYFFTVHMKICLFVWTLVVCFINWEKR